MSDNPVIPEAAVEENERMTIPDEAVEAAAWALDARTMGSGGALAEKFKEQTRAEARRILEAAAPQMLAEVNTRVEQVNLPNGTVILSEQGGIFQHFNGYWFEPGSSYRHHLDDITLPATVIHRPAP